MKYFFESGPIPFVMIPFYNHVSCQYMTARNGEVMGVTLSRAALITNTKAVSQACGYDRGKIIVSLVDPKREVGPVSFLICSFLPRWHCFKLFLTFDWGNSYIIFPCSDLDTF